MTHPSYAVLPLTTSKILWMRNSAYEYEYKVIDFQLMGMDQNAWGHQLINDLENLYVNEGLQIIGGFSKIGRLTEFSLVMSRVSEEASEKAFDLEVKTMIGEIEPQMFEKYLNKQYEENRLIFRCIFTIYQIDRSSIVSGKVCVATNFLVFQKMTINQPLYNDELSFKVKKIPSFNKYKIDPEVAMLDYIEKQKHKNDLELLGIVTNT
jgi:hypothetical protein